MAYSILSVTKMTSAQLATYTGVEGMIVINTDTDSISVLDGTKAGGYSLPNEDTVQSYVNTQVTNIMASGGQVLPAAPTTTGNVITWDGGNWQEDSSFAQTSYVDAQITALKPSTPSTASQALQWDGSNFVNVTMTGGSGGGIVPTVPTPTGSVLTWDGSAYQNTTGFSLTTDLTTAVTNLKGTASLSYDTLGKLETFIKSNETDINTKAIKPNSASTANEVLGWDSSLNSGAGGFVQKDLSGLAAIGTAVTYTDLGQVETKLTSIDNGFLSKAPKPPNGIQAGEFLRWDETNGVFTFATPAGGSSGTSIPTPSATTDTSTAGAMEVLIWDNTSGDLKNVTSPFVETPPASAAGEYLRWDATTGWINDTPAGSGGSSFGTPSSGTLANEAVTWDGTSAFVNTSGYAMLTDLTNKADKPSSVTGANEFIQWTASGWTNTALSTVGVSSGSFVSPTTSTGTGQHVIWNGSAFENASEFATESMLDGMFPLATDATANRAVLSWDGTKTINKNFAPATATPNGEFVKWNGTSFENVALSTTGMTTTGFVNPASGSGFTDALQWDATAGIFKNVSNFRPDSTIDTSTSTDDVLGWDGTQFYKKTLSSSTGAGVMELTHDTINGEYVLSVKASAIAAL